MAQAMGQLSRYAPMKLFNRVGTGKRADRAYDEQVSERMRVVSNTQVTREDPETVETRIRNLNYGSSRR
jgi:hypothetical protein